VLFVGLIFVSAVNPAFSFEAEFKGVKIYNSQCREGYPFVIHEFYRIHNADLADLVYKDGGFMTVIKMTDDKGHAVREYCAGANWKSTYNVTFMKASTGEKSNKMTFYLNVRTANVIEARPPKLRRIK